MRIVEDSLFISQQLDLNMAVVGDTSSILLGYYKVICRLHSRWGIVRLQKLEVLGNVTFNAPLGRKQSNHAAVKS